MQNFQEALLASFKLLSKQALSRKTLTERLSRKGYDNETIDLVLEHLDARHLIGDEKLAREYVEQRLENRPSGRKNIMQELSRKGLNDSLIETVVRDWDEKKEIYIALKALKGQWGETPAELNAKALRQWIGFLLRRGFEEEAAVLAMSAYCGDDLDITDILGEEAGFNVD
jgi:regulatory protein